MRKYDFYIHTISGDIQPLDDWRYDYESMDPESWHGKPIEECNPANWIEDGKLIPLKLTSEGNATLTNRVFSLWYGKAEEGEEYISEWQEIAKDEDGNEYRIIWQFDVIKGFEPYDEELPWDNLDNISRIQSI